MRIAITGGTGFAGGHLATALSAAGHDVIVLARGNDQRPWAREVLSLPGVQHVRAGVGDRDALVRAFAGCDAVAHCAGINRELGAQTYQAVHVDGTANVVAAAEAAGVRRIALLSFLRARPACGSPYHESKWATEEIVRASGLDWTVLKPGVIYGRGDHMLDHIAAALHTLPVFVRLGRGQVRPLAVADLVRVLVAALVDGRLARRTIALMGPTQVSLDQLTDVIAEATGRRPRVLLPVPVSPLYYLPAWLAERVMTVPVLSQAQVRILLEGAAEPVLAPDELPADLTPAVAYDAASVRSGLPAEPARFSRADLRLCAG